MIDFDALAMGPCMQAFGESVVYQPAAGPTVMIQGIFDDAFVPTFPDDGTDLAPTNVTNYAAVVSVQLSQIGFLPAQGDALTVRDTNFVVREARADGRGGMLLMLNLKDSDDDTVPPFAP